MSKPDHKVQKWEGITACGRESGNLNQVLDWDLTTCKQCLKKKKEKQ